jgi:hypothetical protein
MSILKRKSKLGEMSGRQGESEPKMRTGMAGTGVFSP